MAALKNRVTQTKNVWLIDHGYHSSLIFERDNGDFVEYGYGERRWSGFNDGSWWRVPQVMLWPTDAVISRQDWPRNGTRRWQDAYADNGVYSIPAEPSRIDDLLGSLDREMRSPSAFYNQEYALRVAPADESYWLFHNCNRVTAQWLESLGHPVEGAQVFSAWKIEEETRRSEKDLRTRVNLQQQRRRF